VPIVACSAERSPGGIHGSFTRHSSPSDWDRGADARLPSPASKDFGDMCLHLWSCSLVKTSCGVGGVIHLGRHTSLNENIPCRNCDTTLTDPARQQTTLGSTLGSMPRPALCFNSAEIRLYRFLPHLSFYPSLLRNQGEGKVSFDRPVSLWTVVRKHFQVTHPGMISTR
jgi:hypothetical protein